MELIKIKAWDNEIALVSEIQSKIVFELQDKKFACFSPVKLEHDTFMKVSPKNIDELGLIADSISGAYGKTYFSKYYINEFANSPSLLDRLSFIGKNGLGALEFNPSDTSSDVHSDIAFSLSDFKNQSVEVYNGNSSNELAKIIAKSNSGAGGAKAKGVVDYNPLTKEVLVRKQTNEKSYDGYKKCIVKFNTKKGIEAKKYNDELKLEYIYYLLAKELGLTISESWLESDEEDNYYFITKRFDITDANQRLHMHSLAGILSHDASPFTMGYESLFRVGIMLSISSDDKEQMFKTMVFNIVFANRDDHSRNFSFLMDENCNWSYSPAYDLTYSGTNSDLNWHQLTIDKKPTTDVRSLGIIKIAKLCDVKEPLKILANMIDVKRAMLRKFCTEYGVEQELVEMIFKDTANIDKMFGEK